jgi:hypothetical protein
VPADKKTTAAIPFRVAAACITILIVILAITLLIGNPIPVTGSPYSAVADGQAPAVVLPACPPDFVQPEVTVEHIAESSLLLTLPPAEDRIMYSERGFDEPVEAAIAWWMSPGFMDNTTEFRGYERKNPDGKKTYPEEHRIFFDFIQHELDIAEQQSVLKSDHVLFRGISPSVAGTVLNTSRYHEPAFASTSYDISFSLDAFGVRSPDGYRNVLVLERDAGDHALYINEDEREYLLPRGSDWTVTRIANVANLTVNADFGLHERDTGTAAFDHVRLITIRPAACI